MEKWLMIAGVQRETADSENGLDLQANEEGEKKNR